MSDASIGDFRGRVAVVTGGARGMGRAYVEAFLEAGAHVVATDLSWADTLEFKTEIERSGRGLALEFDVTDSPGIAAARDETMKAFGRVDVLINNAAMRQRDLYRP